ncbi:hypothetical protein Tco_0503942 [Tanacetum coccineum]
MEITIPILTADNIAEGPLTIEANLEGPTAARDIPFDRLQWGSQTVLTTSKVECATIPQTPRTATIATQATGRSEGEDDTGTVRTRTYHSHGVGISTEETPATRIPPNAPRHPTNFMTEEVPETNERKNQETRATAPGRLGRTLSPQRIERRMQEGEPIDTINLDDPYELEPLGLEEEEPTNRRTSAHKRLGARGTNASNPKGQELPQSRQEARGHSPHQVRMKSSDLAGTTGIPPLLTRSERRGHYKGNRTNEDLSLPWCRDKVDAFAGCIRRYSEDKKRRMPTNVKTYDGIGSPTTFDELHAASQASTGGGRSADRKEGIPATWQPESTQKAIQRPRWWQSAVSYFGAEDKKRRMPTNVKTYDGIGDPDWLSTEETPATRIPPNALRRPTNFVTEEPDLFSIEEESGDQGNRLAGRLGRTLAPQRIERRMQEGEPIDTINLDDPYELEPLGLEEEEPTNRRTSAHKRLLVRCGLMQASPMNTNCPNHCTEREVIARHTSAHERLGPRRENRNSTPYSRVTRATRRSQDEDDTGTARMRTYHSHGVGISCVNAYQRNFTQRKKYSKNPVELARIRQRSGEYLDSFTEHFKDEMVYFKHCPDLMKISTYMNGINNQDLIKKLNDKVPQTFTTHDGISGLHNRARRSADSKEG